MIGTPCRLVLAGGLALLLLALPVARAGEHGNGKSKGKSAGQGKSKDHGSEAEKSKDQDGQGEKEGEKDADQDENKDGTDNAGGSSEHGKSGEAHGPKDRPPGWDKGKKKGWKDEYPPGWDKLDEGQKKKWREDVEKAKDEVGTHSDAAGMGTPFKTKMQDAVEHMCRKGHAPGEAKQKAVDAVQKGKDGRELLKDNGIEAED